MKSFWACAPIAISMLALALALVGCAFPNQLSLANRSGEMLRSLTHSESQSAADSPSIPHEPSPYPTALKPGMVAAATNWVAPNAATTAPIPPPLPLQQGGLPSAIPLDRQQLAGRLPVQIPDPSATAPARETSAPVVPETIPPAKAPITLEVSPADAVASFLRGAEQSWPVNLKPQLNPPPAPWNSAPAAEHSSAFPPVIPSLPSPAETISPPAPSIDELCQQLIVAFEQDIRARIDRKEEDELPALRQKLRLLQLIADRTDDAVEQVEQLPPAEREAFKQLMFALTTWLSPDDAKRASLRNAKILRSLHEVNTHLSAVSKLDLKNLVFCEKVESFGWFTEFPRAEFTPKQQVILYVEVQNFAAEAKTATAFETELQGSYQIYDTGGNVVDERQLPLDREICRNFRRDYFLAYRIYLPAELAAGKYRLELNIEDLKAKKEFKGKKLGEAMIEFTIKS